MRTETHGNRPRRAGRPRRARAGLLAAVLTALVPVAAACSGGSGTGADASSPAAGGKGPLTYSQCMRAHGIKNFPDPNPNGGIALPNGLDPSSPQFQAADQACKHLQPANQPITAVQQAKISAGNLKYAQCMRGHGISDMPDPDSQGQLKIKAQPGSDLDPSNPRFQAADKACRHFQYVLPGSGGPSLSTSGGGGGQ